MPLSCFASFHDAAAVSPTVTLSQVADLRCLPAQDRVRLDGLAVAVLPRGRSRLVLAPEALASRVRAAYPGVRRWFPEPPRQAIVVTWTSEPRRPPEGSADCLEVVSQIAPGTAPVMADFKASACTDGARDHPFRYDASIGAVRALRDVEVGEVTGGLPDALVSTVSPGDTLYVSAKAGPVRVEREVHAVQPATPHRPMFVRSEDGAVFPVPPVETPR